MHGGYPRHEAERRRLLSLGYHETGGVGWAVLNSQIQARPRHDLSGKAMGLSVSRFSRFSLIKKMIPATALEPKAFCSAKDTLRSVLALISLTAGRIALFLKVFEAAKVSRIMLPARSTSVAPSSSLNCWIDAVLRRTN